MNVRGYEFEKWILCNQGKRAEATKGGRRYQLKQYDTVKPVKGEAMDDRTYEKNLEKFNSFVKYRQRINETLRTCMSEDGNGNIVAPIEEFIDDNHYVEVTDFIEGVVDMDELMAGFVTTLSAPVRDLMLQTMVAALLQVHEAGIIHTDLKLPNILVVDLEESENYVIKLIDFDASTFMNDFSRGIGGTENYMAPEQALFFDTETPDERAELIPLLTDRLDIFCTGLIFHYLLSGGEYPEGTELTEDLIAYREMGNFLYASTILLNGGKIKVSDRITENKYRDLIYDMLSCNPEDRPSAAEVLERLKSEGDEDELSLEETWRDDRIILDEEKFKAAHIRGLKKMTQEGVHCYALRLADGSREMVDAADLLARGLARPMVEEIFDEPWEGHKIEILVDVIKAKGYVACRQFTLPNGVKCYQLFRSSGKASTVTMENLVNFKYAKIKRPEPRPGPGPSNMVDICTPWPEHKIRFNDAKLKQKGYIKVDRKDINGVKGYYLYTDLLAKPNFFNVEKLLMLQYARFVR